MLEELGVDGLAALPPGPALAAALDGVDPSMLDAQGQVRLLQAWSRQHAHDHAQFVRAVTAVAAASRATTAADASAEGDWAAAEIAAALTWTDGKAAREVEFADTLLGRLPTVWAAFDAGVIDHGKAWTFVDVLGCADLTGPQLAAICDAVLPRAPALTAGQLRARLQRAVLRVDPGYAERRYRRAVTHRGVYGYLTADGTAVITADGLPPDEAGAACARVDRLAAAATRAGHPATLPQIRCDVFLGLLDGRWNGMSHDQIVDALLADATAHDARSGAGEPDGAGCSSSSGRRIRGSAVDRQRRTRPHSRPSPPRSESSSTEPTATQPVPTDPEQVPFGPAPGSGVTMAPSTTPASTPQPRTASAPVASASPATPLTEPTEPPAAGPASDEPPGGTAPPARRPEPPEEPPAPEPWELPARCGVEIRVGLSTLLGLDQRPAELPGWGPVLPEIARRLVARQRRAEWRFAITDPAGHLLLAGATRRRPRTSDPGSAPPAQARGGIVELQIPATMLMHLAARPELCGRWANVVADLARQYDQRDELTAALHAHPDRRYLRAALRRHIQVRDRTCVAPGCRRSAAQADGDHTRDHAAGGATLPGNGGPLCRRHHRMKHHGGWTLAQPQPGRFVWTSPLGLTYRTRGEVIWAAEPDSRTRPDTQDEEDGTAAATDRRGTGPTFDPTPPRPCRPPPVPAPPSAPARDDAPF